MLGAAKELVSVDETLVKKHHWGQQDQDLIWVFGAYEHRTGTVVVEVLPRHGGRTSECLTGLIQKHINPGSKIYSDGLASYQGLNKLGFEHEIVNHSSEFARPGNNGEIIHTNFIERFWHTLKTDLRRFNGLHRDHIPSYLDEIVWRWNRRTKDPFLHLLECIAQHPSYKF